ncbi:MAG: hypothetical protein RSG77_05365 [Hafnia sp.]|uniref:hypothetical protein n=1 Tax=Hafnia sp. TaxID=1873498 RepID=UPI002FC85453
MAQPEMHIEACSVSDVLDWLNDVGPLKNLPAVELSTNHWFTLNGSNVVRLETLQKKNGPVVIILYQSGLVDQPEKVWPELQFYALQAAHAGERLWLVLAGGMLLQREVVWRQNLSFATPGKPPLGRLLAFGLLLSVLCGMPARVSNILRRFVDRNV